MKKQIKAIMLPTKDKKTNLIFNDANHLCYQSNKSFKNDRKSRKRFHIYITSDEEIKEGDKVYYRHPKHLHRDGMITTIENWNHSKDELSHAVRHTEGYGVKEGYRKIIATSDRSLKIKIPLENRTGLHITKKLPNVSQNFIKAFVESNGKEDWEIEYEQYWSKVNGEYPKEPQFRFKLDSDNCVIITKKEKLCKHCGNPL